jgi:hypothetical protein
MDDEIKYYREARGETYEAGSIRIREMADRVELTYALSDFGQSTSIEIDLDEQQAKALRELLDRKIAEVEEWKRLEASWNSPRA